MIMNNFGIISAGVAGLSQQDILGVKEVKGRSVTRTQSTTKLSKSVGTTKQQRQRTTVAKSASGNEKSKAKHNLSDEQVAAQDRRKRLDLLRLEYRNGNLVNSHDRDKEEDDDGSLDGSVASVSSWIGDKLFRSNKLSSRSLSSLLKDSNRSFGSSSSSSSRKQRGVFGRILSFRGLGASSPSLGDQHELDSDPTHDQSESSLEDDHLFNDNNNSNSHSNLNSQANKSSNQSLLGPFELELDLDLDLDLDETASLSVTTANQDQLDKIIKREIVNLLLKTTTGRLDTVTNNVDKECRNNASTKPRAATNTKRRTKANQVVNESKTKSKRREITESTSGRSGVNRQTHQQRPLLDASKKPNSHRSPSSRQHQLDCKIRSHQEEVPEPSFHAQMRRPTVVVGDVKSGEESRRRSYRPHPSDTTGMEDSSRFRGIRCMDDSSQARGCPMEKSLSLRRNRGMVDESKLRSRVRREASRLSGVSSTDASYCFGADEELTDGSSPRSSRRSRQAGVSHGPSRLPPRYHTR
jgi:hypothetical protein